MRDAVKHSQSQTPVREALESWEEWKALLRKKTQRFKDKEWLNADAAEIKEMLNSLYGITDKIADLLDTIYWPRTDVATCRESDERGVEQAARHLLGGDNYCTSTGGIECAWDIANQALGRYCQWQHNEYYASIGVNLSGYFRAELDAILAVIQRHHVVLADSAQKQINK